MLRNLPEKRVSQWGTSLLCIYCIYRSFNNRQNYYRFYLTSSVRMWISNKWVFAFASRRATWMPHEWPLDVSPGLIICQASWRHWHLGYHRISEESRPRSKWCFITTIENSTFKWDIHMRKSRKFRSNILPHYWHIFHSKS